MIKTTMDVSTSDLPGEAYVTALGDDAIELAAIPRARLGRYAIEGVLGAGGMAVVYLARDPVLDRAVALKVLHVDDDERGADRLVREGQALARVSHPNVIHVYEVGREADGLIYIAMERIVGVTLATWLEKPRTLDQIVQVFAAAGRGLAAAHAAGIVHRDFKPENVMVGDDGRVCVLDFGLAREFDEPGGPREARRGLAQTVAGSVIGTPAYMSPEQWRGERAGAASDQFSFCVTLWRALTGEHPFDTGSREALRAAVLAGDARPLPRGVPRRLRAVLRRGLARDPRARFASIDAVVAALAARPRRRWLLAAAIVAAGGALASQLVGGGPARALATTVYAAPVAITSRGDVARSAVSPDGQRVALLTQDAVIVQPLQPGADPRVVARGRLAHHALSWSPDGTRLAFVGAVAGSAAPSGLVVLELATGAVRRLGDNLGFVALLGNDELAATIIASNTLAFYSFANLATPRRRCPLPGPIAGVRGLSYDPASDALYVQVDDNDRRSSILRIDRACRRIEVVADRLPILSFAVRPTDHRVLARLMGSHHLVEIGDDGTSQLAQHVIQSNEYAPLAIAAGGAIVHRDRSVRWGLDAVAAGGGRSVLAGGAGESRFSLAPDGRIAQVDGLYDRGLLRVGRLAALGDGMTTIADHVVRAVWSPDGRRLAVLRQTDGGYQLARWDAATGALSPAHPLVTPYDVELTWLDDDRVAYPVLHDRTEFRWLDLATGATGGLVPAPGEQVLSLVRAHRDRRLAFVTDTVRALTVWTTTEGGAPRALATVAADAPRSARSMRVTWAADDRSLVLYDGVSGDMWSIDGGDPARTGAVTRLPRIETRAGGLTRFSDVFVLADRMIVGSVVATSDVYVSAPMEP